jgi:hypothetical protein
MQPLATTRRHGADICTDPAAAWYLAGIVTGALLLAALWGAA